MVVVFGGTGFLGWAIVEAIAATGVPVRVASRRPPRPMAGGAGEGGPEDAAGHASAARPEHVSADVRDGEAVARAVSGASAVVNAVSLYVERGSATFEAIHVEGARRVAQCAREAGAEAHVHISGLGVDAASPSRFVRARARGEQAVHEAFERAVVVRPSVVFGRGDHFLAALESVTRLPVVPLFGSGGTRLQPVYAPDLGAAVAKLTVPAAAGGSPAAGARTVFEFGGAQVLTYREVLERVMDHLGRKRPLLPLPFGFWKAAAAPLGLLPSPPLTSDQIVLMQSDNVVSGTEPGFAELGLEPSGLSDRLAHCLRA